MVVGRGDYCIPFWWTISFLVLEKEIIRKIYMAAYTHVDFGEGMWTRGWMKVSPPAQNRVRMAR